MPDKNKVDTPDAPLALPAPVETPASIIAADAPERTLTGHIATRQTPQAGIGFRPTPIDSHDGVTEPGNGPDPAAARAYAHHMLANPPPLPDTLPVVGVDIAQHVQNSLGRPDQAGAA